MPLRDRPRLVASSSSATKLFIDDLREVSTLSRDESKSRSDIIRELVHEALRLRRLRAMGRDEGENYIRKIHRDAIDEGLDPLMKAVAEIRSMMEESQDRGRSESQSVDEAKTIELLLKVLAQLLQRAIITENIIKVLMTVGMQKDSVGSEEIRKQLLSQDEQGAQQAKELMKRLISNRLAVELIESE